MELQKVLMRLKAIKEERLRLDYEEYGLSKPCLTDFDMIPEVLGYCHEAFYSFHSEGGVSKPEERRRFLFVLIFLYSPKTLAGGKMGNGLRSKLAEAMGVEPSNISHYHSDILFYYNLYPSFRDDVNGIFEKVFERLRKK